MSIPPFLSTMTSVSEHLDRMFSPIRLTWLHGFLLSEDPIHIPYLQDTSFLNTTFIGHRQESIFPPTASFGPESTPVFTTTVSYFFGPALTLASSTVGFGVAQLSSSPSDSPFAPQDDILPYRFLIHAPSDSMLMVFDNPAQNIVAFIQSYKSSDGSSRESRAIFRRPLFQQLVSKHPSIPTSLLSRTLVYFRNVQSTRICSHCAFPKQSQHFHNTTTTTTTTTNNNNNTPQCDCASQQYDRNFYPHGSSIHPFNHSHMLPSLRRFTGFYRGHAEHVVLNNAFPLHSFTNFHLISIRPMRDRSIIPPLRNAILSRHAHSQIPTPRADAPLIPIPLSNFIYAFGPHIATPNRSAPSMTTTSHVAQSSPAPPASPSAASHLSKLGELVDTLLHQHNSQTSNSTTTPPPIQQPSVSTDALFDALLQPLIPTEQLHVPLISPTARPTSTSHPSTKSFVSNPTLSQILPSPDIPLPPPTSYTPITPQSSSHTSNHLISNNSNPPLSQPTPNSTPSSSQPQPPPTRPHHSVNGASSSPSQTPSASIPSPPVLPSTSPSLPPHPPRSPPSSSPPIVQPPNNPTKPSPPSPNDNPSAESDDERARKRRTILRLRRDRNRQSARRANARVKAARAALIRDVEDARDRVSSLRKREMQLRLENLRLRKRVHA